MISFLQRILQKHHKWLFSILLVVVTISFVFTVGSSPGIGRGASRNIRFLEFDLTSQKAVTQWQQEVQYSAKLRNAFFMPMFSEFAIFARLTELSLANKLGIPEPNKAQLSQFVETYAAFMDSDHKFDANKYNAHLESLKSDAFQQGLFEQTIINDFRCNAVEHLLMDQGTILPAEVQYVLESKKQVYDVVVASFNQYDDESKTIDESDLDKYYQQNKDRYKLDSQIVFDYIKFPKDHFNVAPASKEDLQAFYAQHKSEFTQYKEGSQELKDAIVHAYERQEIQNLAVHSADQLVYRLYEKNIDIDSEAFQQALQDFGGQVKTLEPISVKEVNNNSQFSGEILTQCEKLNEDRYYSDPVISKSGDVCVILYRDTLPQIDPPFESVRAEVTADFLQNKKEIYLQQQAQSAQNEIKSLADSKDFEKIQSIVQKYNGNVKPLSATISKLMVSSDKKDEIKALKEGECSEVYQDRDAYSFICLQKKTLPQPIEPQAIISEMAKMEKADRTDYSECLMETIFNEIHAERNPRESSFYRTMFFGQNLR